MNQKFFLRDELVFGQRVDPLDWYMNIQETLMPLSLFGMIDIFITFPEFFH